MSTRRTAAAPAEPRDWDRLRARVTDELLAEITGRLGAGFDLEVR